MLLASAMARMRLNSQASSEPTLTDQELEDILTLYALEDAEERSPEDVAWVGTWDLPAAYRKAWLVKAGKVSPEVSFNVDGAQYSQSDLFDHCLAMAEKFGAVVGNISLGAS